MSLSLVTEGYVDRFFFSLFSIYLSFFSLSLCECVYMYVYSRHIRVFYILYAYNTIYYHLPTVDLRQC